MLVARVKGTVVCTQKSTALIGTSLILVSPIDPDTLQEKKSVLVAADGIGVAEGEIVLCLTGSAARLAKETEAMPADLSILAVLDSIEVNGTLTYIKFPERQAI